MNLRPVLVVALGTVVGWTWFQQGACQPVSQRSPALPATPEQLPAFEERIRLTYEQALPSIGMMIGPSKLHEGGGVIVSNEGHFLTHAHHELQPGSRVTVVLGNGRKISGELLGVHSTFDLSLLKLNGEGPWPAVPLGTTAVLKPGDPCLAIGYPVAHTTFYGERHAKGMPPLPRLGRFLGLHQHHVMTSCRTSGGDSGGPLLNLRGELLGTHGLAAKIVDGSVVRVSGFTSVDIYWAIRDQLLQKKVFTEDALQKKIEKSDDPSMKRFAVKGPFESTEGLAGLAAPAYRSVVTVYCEGKQVAFGLAVATDGWIVTRASALSGTPVCHLADGRKLEASVARRWQEHDLAMLKVSATDLVKPVWSETSGPPVGRVVATIGPQPKPLSFGIVCSAVESVPPVKGMLKDGLAEVYVHDGDLAREQCGGPVVDSTGQVAAINIAVGMLDRTRTYALPAAVVRKAAGEVVNSRRHER